MNKREKIKLFFKKRPERVSLSAYSINFDWTIILIISFLIGMGGLVYGAIVYTGIVSGKSFEEDEVSVPETLAEEKRIKIKQTVELLNQEQF